jgi:pyruvate-formate lyase-activating enzyme
MDVADALRLLLGLGHGPLPSYELLPRPDSERFPPVLVHMGLLDGQALQVELRDRDAEPPPWLRGTAVGLGYRTDGGDPLAHPIRGPRLKAIGRRFLQIQSRCDPRTLARAIDALRRAELQTPYVGTSRFGTLARHFDRDGHDIWCHPEGSRESSQATLRLGFRCNQRCRFCWQGRDWPDAPADRWRTDLEQIAARGVRTVTITGGEPTIYGELLEIVAAAAGLGLWVHLQTNAIRLRDRAYTASLVDAGLTSMFVSLHSADPSISDRLTGAVGTHARTVEGVVAALEAGVRVKLNAVVERATLSGLPAHARLIVDRLGGVERVSYSHPNNYFDRDAWRQALVPHDEVREPLVEASRILLTAGIAVDVLGTCGFPSCLVADIPELLQAVRPDDFDRLDTTGRLYGHACGDCALQPECLGLRREYMDIYGDRGIRPIRR